MIGINPQQNSDNSVDILLAEDNPGDVRLTREALKTTAGSTRLPVVNNGADAIDFVKQRGEYEETPAPDLVLLDLNLPEKDGCEVLKTIREEPPFRLLPVIMLTSSEDSEDIERCYEADANAYLTKPTDPSQFFSLVTAVKRFWFDKAQLPPIPA